jgi:hypothetical protein
MHYCFQMQYVHDIARLDSQRYNERMTLSIYTHIYYVFFSSFFLAVTRQAGWPLTPHVGNSTALLLLNLESFISFKYFIFLGLRDVFKYCHLLILLRI